MYPLEIPDHHGTLIKPLYWVRYRILDKLDMDKAQVIYIPTEANMPITEAGRSVHHEAAPLVTK